MGEKNLCTSLMGNPPLLNDVLKGNSAGKDEDTIFNSDIELLHNSFLNHYCGLVLRSRQDLCAKLFAGSAE